MCKVLSKFDRLLVEGFKNDRFPGLDERVFSTLLFSRDVVTNKLGERIFVYVLEINDNGIIEILYRPADAELIDVEDLEDSLYRAYINGDCASYDLECVDDGQIEIFFNDRHDDEAQLELVSLFEEAVRGEVRGPELE